MEEIRYNTIRAVWLPGFCSFWMIASFECQIGYSPGTTFLFSLPVFAARNTYLMHHTCVRYTYTCLYVGSIVHFRHTNCKIGGERVTARHLRFSNVIVLSLICLIQIKLLNSYTLGNLLLIAL